MNDCLPACPPARLPACQMPVLPCAVCRMLDAGCRMPDAGCRVCCSEEERWKCIECALHHLQKARCAIVKKLLVLLSPMPIDAAFAPLAFIAPLRLHRFSPDCFD